MAEEKPSAPIEVNEVLDNAQYMKCLKKRVTALQKKHDEIVNQSIDIIEEISCITTLTTSPEKDGKVPIKKLMEDFQQDKAVEPTKKEVTIEEDFQLQNVLDKLNQTNVLAETKALLMKAKLSFGRIDGILNNRESKTDIPDDNAPNVLGQDGSVRHKIKMFNCIGHDTATLSAYASCSSSFLSADLRSTEDILNKGASNSVENGYDGDNDDSEYDIVPDRKYK